MFVFTTAVRANTFNFLHDIDVRDSGAQGALAPFSSGAFSTFIDPAGLAYTSRQTAALTYYNLFQEANLSAASFAYPLMEAGTISVSGVLVNTGKSEERDAANVVTGDFTDSYRVFNLSYGVNLLPFLSAGVTAKYIGETLYRTAYNSYGADFGLIMPLPSGLRASLMVENFIKPVLTYSDTNDTLPLLINANLGWQTKILQGINDSLKLGCGFTKEEFTADYVLRFGAEYTYNDFASARLGISTEGLSAGASVGVLGAAIDYAFIMTAYDFVHRFGLSYSYGDDIRAAEEKVKSQKDRIKIELVNKIRQETVNQLRQDIIDFIKSGDYDKASDSVEKAMVWAPEDSWFADKRKEIDGLLKQGQIKTYFADADKYYTDKLYIEEMVVLKNILDLDPENKTAKDKFAAAQEIVTKLGDENIIIEQKNRVVIKQHFTDGLSNYTSGNYELAIKEWAQVIKASPMTRQVYEYIKSAEAKIHVKEEKQKQVKLEREMKISSLYNRAVLLYTKGDFQESIKIWRELLNLDPENTDAKDYLKKITEEFKNLQKQELGW
jgi:tetratricopeptide (TPR) repeat protein